MAYLLWFFLGLLGGHRFYLNKTGSAVVMLVISITIFGLMITWPWWVIDAFLIPGMLQEKRSRLRQELADVARGVTPENPYENLASYHDPAAARSGPSYPERGFGL